MCRANSIVIPGGKLDLAMQLILTPHDPAARRAEAPRLVKEENSMTNLARDWRRKAPPLRPSVRWPTQSAPSPWTPWRRRIPAIRACRWAWRTSQPSSSQIPEVRSERAAVAGPRPLRPLGRPRLDAALLPALFDRLSGHDGRPAEAVPAARLARPPAILNTATRRASRRRPGRSARALPLPSAWRSPSVC